MFAVHRSRRASSLRREFGCYWVATLIEQVASIKQLPASSRWIAAVAAP